MDSLQKRALIRTAIKLCQDDHFKEIAFNLEKPVYGAILSRDERNVLLRNKKKIAKLNSLKKNSTAYKNFAESCVRVQPRIFHNWNAALNEQCQRLTEILPDHFKHPLQVWIARIALQNVNYCHRMQRLYDLSRYFLLNFIGEEDWTDSGRLNEKKIAERLVRCETVDSYQRYRIACTYCLEDLIPELWEQIPTERKNVFYGVDELVREPGLVQLWSFGLAEKLDKLNVVDKKDFMCLGFHYAVSAGETVAAIYFWSKLSQNERQKYIKRFTLWASKAWMLSKSYFSLHAQLEHPEDYNTIRAMTNREHLHTLPVCNNDILHFLLSKMSKAQLRTFFKASISEFGGSDQKSILECFLDWPYQDFLMPTVSLLSDSVQESHYIELLKSVAAKYKRQRPKVTILVEDYDYGTLLLDLLKKAPEHYRRYLFSYKDFVFPWGNTIPINSGSILLSLASRKRPFNNSALELFRSILKVASVEEKKEIINSEIGHTICDDLIRIGSWELANFVLAEFLSEEDIYDFKRNFMLSYNGRKVCFTGVKEGQAEFVERFFRWELLSSEEITEYKHALIFKKNLVKDCRNLILKNQLDCVDRMLLWFFPSAEEQQQFKVQFAQTSGSYVCFKCLKDGEWEMLEQFLTWCFSSEAAIEQFKQELFSLSGVDIHLKLVIAGRWQDAELFFKWCRLSPAAVEQCKKESLFLNLNDFRKLLLRDEKSRDFLKNGGKWQSIALLLRWCLRDEASVLAFKKEIEAAFPSLIKSKKRKKLLLQNFNRVIKEQLSDLSSKQQTKKRKAGVLVEAEIIPYKRLAL